MVKKIAKKKVKKTLKKQVKSEREGAVSVEEPVVEEGGLGPEEEAAKEEPGEEKEKGKLFEKKQRTTIFKLKAVEDKTAILYGKDKMEAIREELEETHEILDIYAIREPFSYSIIGIEEESRELRYFAVEPELLGKEKEIYDFIVDTLSKIMKYNQKMVKSRNVLEEYLTRKVKEVIEDMSIDLTPGGEERVIYFLLRDYIGYGKLQILIDDDNLEDISCDGTNVPLFVYHRKFEQLKTDIKFHTSLELEGYVVSLAQKCGKNISVANPILDTTTPDSHRVNMTFGNEVTTRGSTISIRKFNADPLTIVDLINYGTLTPQMAAHMWMAVQYQDSMLFVGGSASGKTATMIASAMFIPWESKIISIEDTREINIPQENWLPGVTREAFGGGKAVSMYDLLRAALRQRPEYLLVGEVRGEETMTMFQAMATGHTTYSTMHGNSAEDVTHRLENPPINVPRVLMEALNLMIIHTNAVIREKGGKRNKVRRIKEMREITDYVPSTNEINSGVVFKWSPGMDTFKYEGHSHLLEKVAERENLGEDEVRREMERREEIIQWMVDNGVTNYHRLTAVIQEYYADKVHLFKDGDQNKIYSLIKKGKGERLLGIETD